MARWVALFRGINVGGRNSLPMKALVGELEALGLRRVRTYIQSGNVVFESAGEDPADLGERIAERIARSHGFAPEVLVLGADAFEEAARANPFPEAIADPGTLHLSFLAATPESPDLDALEAVRAPSERFRLVGRVFYLHAPDGIGRSKLAAKVERALGVAATARNWRTVEALRRMLRD